MPLAGYQGQYIKTISLAIDQKFNEDEIKLKELIPKIDDRNNQDQYMDCLIENTKKLISTKKFNQIKKQSLDLIKKDFRMICRNLVFCLTLGSQKSRCIEMAK